MIKHLNNYINIHERKINTGPFIDHKSQNLPKFWEFMKLLFSQRKDIYF